MSDLLDEYKELGEGGVTEAEGRRMREILDELRTAKSNWEAAQCRSLAPLIGDTWQQGTAPPEIEQVLAPAE